MRGVKDSANHSSCLPAHWKILPLLFSYCWYTLIKKGPRTVWPGWLTLPCMLPDTKLFLRWTPQPQTQTYTKIDIQLCREALCSLRTRPLPTIASGYRHIHHAKDLLVGIRVSRMIPALPCIICRAPCQGGSRHSCLLKSKCHSQPLWEQL